MMRSYDALKVLDFDKLKLLVIEKELDIDSDDYEEAPELLIAICEELDVEIPAAE